MKRMPGVDLRPSRRAVNAMLASAAGARLLSGSLSSADASVSEPRPFRVNVPQEKIDRILARVRSTDLPDRLEAPDLRYGVSWDYMRDVIRYWTEQYDWRKAGNCPALC
jgi:hypothetical protein